MQFFWYLKATTTFSFWSGRHPYILFNYSSWDLSLKFLIILAQCNKNQCYQEKSIMINIILWTSYGLSWLFLEIISKWLLFQVNPGSKPYVKYTIKVVFHVFDTWGNYQPFFSTQGSSKKMRQHFKFVSFLFCLILQDTNRGPHNNWFRAYVCIIDATIMASMLI